MERTFDERFERPRILPPAVGGKRTMSMTVGADEKGEEYANEAEVRVEMQSGEFMHSTQTCTVKRASFEPTPAADTNECGEVYEDENKTWSRQQHQHQGHGRDGSASRFSNPSFHPPSTRIITALHPAVVGALEVANPTAGGCDVNLALVPNVSTTWTGGWEINAKQHLRELTDAMYNCNDDGGNGDGDGDDGEYEEGHGQGGRMMGELKASASMSTSTSTSTSSSSPSTHGSAGDMMMIQAFQSARVSKQKEMRHLMMVRSPLRRPQQATPSSSTTTASSPSSRAQLFGGATYSGEMRTNSDNSSNTSSSITWGNSTGNNTKLKWSDIKARLRMPPTTSTTNGNNMSEQHLHLQAETSDPRQHHYLYQSGT